MKLAVCSDLHLEFGYITLDNPGDVDVLILSGDICVAADVFEYSEEAKEMGTSFKKSDLVHSFFQHCCAQFPHVLYVVGNHEHYHGDYKYTISKLKQYLGYLPNLHLLDKETFELDDYVFIGSTLWTDMNKGDALTLYHMTSMMNDFRVIKNSDRYTYRNVPIYDYDENGSVKLDENKKQVQIGMKKKEEVSRFSPEDCMEEHHKCLDYIRHVCDNTPPWKTVVVVGHHTPSYQSCASKYVHDTLMNGGYHSDLSEFILDRPQIKLWTHGHTHEPFDYMIGETRVVCNPRGYINYEAIADNFKLKVINL